jgi:diketogulonate reductase-like aldo/keto reductase
VKGCYEEAWQAMEEIYQSGRTKAIGVSNFLEHHLEDLLRIGKIVPAVNQVEFHPYLVQPGLLAFCKNHNIQVQARNPLMQGQIITDPTVLKLAEKYQKTPAQIVLRWDLQHEVVTIPKSIHPERIEENSKIFNFELSQSDMEVLDGLDAGKRLGSHPDHFTH